MRNDPKSQPTPQPQTRKPHPSPLTPQPSSVRCAVYTRKSTEDGLEQEFNSLDAQRLAGESFIASQVSEGWTCLPDRYDDGGYTGGNLDRPALRRLLADIEAGKVDCIVVYKVDRLSRSLIDFSKIMDVLDRRGVAFVSVTQQFNTGTSMGRLMLNVLLSFAQFEREMISERTRDKMAATRRQGKWTGGCPVLGYDVVEGGGRLRVNEEEAVLVRAIFELYLERESLLETARELEARGWTTKLWTAASTGRRIGGRPFNQNNLYGMLTNPIYLGKITYKKELHPGEHPAIVDAEVFDRVQRRLKSNWRIGGAHLRNRHGVLLKGLVRCASCGCAMTPNHCVNHGRDGARKLYRYYCCLKALRTGWDRCPAPSVSAPQLERFIVEEIRRIGQDSELLADTLAECRRQRGRAIGDLEAERVALERELRSTAAVVRAATVSGAGSAERLADAQGRHAAAERRATEVREQILALSREMVQSGEVVDACSLFDPMWETLTAREQARILHLLVERIDYNGPKGTVAITFRPTGIKTLSDEREGGAATAAPEEE